MSNVRDPTDISSYDAVQVELMKEMIPVLDKNDKVLRAGTKKECHLVDEKGDIILHRAFSVFLFNNNNELLIQKRADEKITFPNLWANTCCSHPLYVKEELNEENALGIKTAAIRKLEHELGLSPSLFKTEDFHFVTRIHYKGLMENSCWGEHEIDYCLLVKKDIKLEDVQKSMSLNEVSEVKFLNEVQLKTILEDEKERKTLTPWFDIISTNFLFKWWSAVKDNKIDSIIDDKTIHRL